MGFLCELGLALGKSLAEVWSLSAAEISVWLAFRQRHGFGVDRVTHGVAAAGAYIGSAWGGKAKPADLMPRFARPVEREDVEAVRAWFDAVGKK